MGRRSRKRGYSGGAEAPAETDLRRTGSSRAERDAARRRRAEAAAGRGASRRRSGGPGNRRGPGGERPSAPWGAFPLTELVILLGLVLGVAGLIVWGDRGRTMFAAAFALCSLAGLEISIREHVAGYRSHTTLLAGAAAIAAMIAVFLAAGAGGIAPAAVLLLGATVFGVAFWLLRRLFQRRSGGLSFR